MIASQTDLNVEKKHTKMVHYLQCVTNNFFLCLYSHQNEADANTRDLARECIEQCLPKGKIPDTRSGICLFECFENKIKKKDRKTWSK
jgi:hypothetical protein